jgi:hypothetical protein
MTEHSDPHFVEKLLQRIATHEAGHAVANFHFGQETLEVTLDFDDEKGVVAGHTVSDAYSLDSVADAVPFSISLFAGYAAEHVLLGNEPRLADRQGDWQDFTQRVGPLFPNPRDLEDFEKQTMNDAVTLMQSYIPEVTRIADALCAKRRLTGLEIEELIWMQPKQTPERRLRDAWQFSSGRDVFDVAALADCDPRKFMTPEECQAFDSLPDEFMVYRGYQGDNRDGVSWTLSREAAEMFSRLRELPEGQIIERWVKKSEVFACLDTDEQEVIILKTA